MNISQPAPGFPEENEEVTLVAEDWDSSTGVVIHRQLWSDGSRRHVTDGVEEIHGNPPLTAVVEEVVTNAEDAAAAAEAEAQAIAEKLAQATEEERAAVEAELARVEELAAETEAKVAAEVEAEEPAVEEAVSEVEDEVESVVDQVEEKAKKVWETIEDFEFKTIEQLKELAKEHGINLHGETAKPKIIEAFKQEDKHEA